MAIVHELGHAFGLADTYNYKEHHQSTGGLGRYKGHATIIAGVWHPCPAPRPRRDPPYIKEDDRKGIIWLYKYTYENQPLDDCLFLDYVFEVDPVRAELGWGGCRPKYPLIHELKYGASL